MSELVGAAERSLVLEDFSAEELDVAAVVGSVPDAPFLADRRVVVLREAGRFNLDQLQPLPVLPGGAAADHQTGGGGGRRPAAGQVRQRRSSPCPARPWSTPM